MMDFIQSLREKAKHGCKQIVFPESAEPRVLQAVDYLVKNNLVDCVLVGDKGAVKTAADTCGVTLSNVEIVQPLTSPLFESYKGIYFDLRKHKGVTPEQSHEIISTPVYYAAMMVRQGECDGAVAGSVLTTGDVMRAAIQIVGTAPGVSLVSSMFAMVLKDERVLTFGDCAIVPDPDPEQLADIAITSAKTHYNLTGETPRVALLSFSTKGSAKHPRVEKVSQAYEIVRKKAPELDIDGELQFDAAFVESVGARKAPESKVAGRANVFIFPDLDSGNISYKVAERLAGIKAVGPVIQGLAKPINDLSRGCSWEDIVNVACICSLLGD